MKTFLSIFSVLFLGVSCSVPGHRGEFSAINASVGYGKSQSAVAGVDLDGEVATLRVEATQPVDRLAGTFTPEMGLRVAVSDRSLSGQTGFERLEINSTDLLLAPVLRVSPTGMGKVRPYAEVFGGPVLSFVDFEYVGPQVALESSNAEIGLEYGAGIGVEVSRFHLGVEWSQSRLQDLDSQDVIFAMGVRF